MEENPTHRQEVNELTLQGMARKVNNVNLDEEIVVVQDWEVDKSKVVLPARVDALLILLCTAGKGRIGIDLREYDVKTNTLVIIQPKNYVHL